MGLGPHWTKVFIKKTDTVRAKSRANARPRYMTEVHRHSGATAPYW